VFLLLERAVKEWPAARMVVTSRPFSTEKLVALSFQKTTIRPFSRAQIRDFLGNWVAAVPGATEVYRAELEQAILERREIEELAENPVMLTCLCVVHWNERRQLPRGRAAAYKAVFHWLLEARREQRAEFVYELAALSGCPNAPPYRVADRAILPRIAGVAGPRVIARLRKEGAHRLVDACLVRAARVGAASARDHLMAMFTRSSLGPTTLHALDLDGDEALRARVGEICSSAPAGAS
jgi:hypothetical protein